MSYAPPVPATVAGDGIAARVPVPGVCAAPGGLPQAEVPASIPVLGRLTSRYEIWARVTSSLHLG